MKDLGEDAIVLITSTEYDTNQRFGTGFIIHLEENETIVLTCAHVVKDVGGNDQVRIGERPVEVVSVDEECDLAVLRICERLPEKCQLPLQVSMTPDSAFTTIGFRKLKDQYLAKPLQGRLGKQGNLYGPKSLTGQRSLDLIIDDAEDTLEMGYSGSPVMDKEGSCIGIISYREGSGEKGLAISIEALTKIWEQKPDHILPVPIETIPDQLLPAAGKPRMDRHDEMKAFNDMASGTDQRTKLLVLYGLGGMGKTRLLEEYRKIALQFKLEVLSVTLAEQISIIDFLDQIISRYPHHEFAFYQEHAMSFRPETRQGEEEWHRILTHKFFQDLRSNKSAMQLVVLIDKYEDADRTFRKWLDEVFLPRISIIGILVVVAGRKEAARNLSENPIQCRFKLQGLSKEHFRKYTKAMNVEVDPKIIEALHSALNGAPLAIVNFVQPQCGERYHE